MTIIDATLDGEFYILGAGQVCFIQLNFTPHIELLIAREFNLFLSVNIDTIGVQRLKIFAKSVKPLLHSSA